MSKLPLSLLVAGASALAIPSLMGASFSPNDPYYPSSADTWGQWHLRSSSSLAAYFDGVIPSQYSWLNNVRGNNVVGAWSAGYTGAGVVIGIIDDGVEGGHPDLAANYRGDLSRNFSQGAIANQAQRPYDAADMHGTSVAGVAAAVGGNGIGGTGAAPHAQIAGMRIRLGGATTEDPAVTDTDLKNAFLWQSGVTESGTYTGEAAIHIKNNSYSYSVPFYPIDAATTKAINTASKNNVIFVFAAGNARGEYTEQASSQRMNALPDSINVAAFAADGKYSYYSSFGSSVFVAAASNGALVNTTGGIVDIGIVTTDRTGTNGYALGDYTSDFGGTSSASPLVAGIIALGKEANSALNARWAKQAFATTSIKVDTTDKSMSSGVVNWDSTTYVGRGWQTNGAGLSFNNNYGFGLADAGAFVRRVVDIAYLTEQTTYTYSAEGLGEKFYPKQIDFGSGTNTGNSDLDPNGHAVSHKFTLSAADITQSLENVVISLDISGGRAWKDLLIQIISPSGMVSDLYMPMTEAPTQAQIDAADQVAGRGLTWDFVTNAFWGEAGQGEWTVVLRNFGNETMTLNDVSILFNQGDAVLESALTAPISKNISAHALVIDNTSTNFVLPTGLTFTVADSTILNNGKIEIGGRVAETDFKGNQVSINGGTFTVLASGSVDAKRGAVLSGGTLNLGGALNTPAGTILQETTTVDGNTSTQMVKYGYGLVMTGGTLNAGDNGSVGTGILQTSGTINIASGKKLATPSLEVQGTFANNALSSAGNVALAGTLAGNLIARDGAVVNATGNAKITGNLVITGVRTAAEGNAALVTVEAGSSVAVTGGVNVANGTLTINAPNFKAGQILVSGGTLNVTPAITFDTTVAQIGGTIRLAENTVFTKEVALGGGQFITSSTTGKTLTTPRLLLEGAGVFSPGGTAPVTLNLNGDFTMNGGMLAVDVVGTSSDYLNISGKAVLNNGVLALTTNAAPQLADIGNKVIPILTATEGISGTIRYVTGDNSYSDRPTGDGGTYIVPISYKFAADTVTSSGSLIVGYDYASGKFLDQLTSNQREVGVVLNVLETNSGGQATDPLLLALNQLRDVETLADSYDQLMPVNLLTLPRSATKQATALTSTFDRRSRDLRRGSLQPGSFWTNYLFGDSVGFNFNAHPVVASTSSGFIPYTGLSEEYPLTLWMNGGASYWKGDAVGSSPNTKSTQYTGTLGLDYRWEDGFGRNATTYDAGVLIGYNSTTDKIGQVGSRNDLDAIAFAGYLSAQYNGFYVNALASYAINSYEFRRDVNIAGMLTTTAEASPDGSQYLGYIGAGYEWEFKDWNHGPTASFQYTKTRVDGYTESGAGAQNLTVDDQDFESILASVGYRISTRVQTGWATLLPEVRASWNHEFKDNTVGISSNMGGSLPFTVYTEGAGSDYATLGLGLTMLLTEQISLSLDYDATLFQKNMDPQHTVNAMLRVSF